MGIHLDEYLRQGVFLSIKDNNSNILFFGKSVPDGYTKVDNPEQYIEKIEEKTNNGQGQSK